MTDIPTLGGTLAMAQCANNRGQVIGQSNLTGDGEQHAFSWDHGTLTDLGTLGGTMSIANWLNEAGEVVGFATTPEDADFHAILWKNGVITDLGALDGDCFAQAWAINSKGQIVGQSFNCETNTSRTVLWDKGIMMDLNVASADFEPLNINDKGEITGVYFPAGCDNTDLCSHAFVLVPCNKAGVQGCDNADIILQPNPVAITMRAATTEAEAKKKIKNYVARLRAQLVQNYHIPGYGTRPE